MNRQLLMPLALILAACAAPATDSPAATATSTGIQVNAPTDTTTPVPITDTPRPTSTERPTRTPTAAPVSTESATIVPPTLAPTSASSGDPFSPKLRSVWDLKRSQYVIADACPGGPLPNLYGFVQITPQGDTLGLLDQAGTTYTFSRTRPNTYYFSGHYSGLLASEDGSVTPAVADGSVAMTLEFTNTNTLVMQRVFTLDNNSACQITDDYTGVFQWNAQ